MRALSDSVQMEEKADFLSPEIRILGEICHVCLHRNLFFILLFMMKYCSDVNNLHSVLSIYSQSSVYSSQTQDLVCSSSPGYSSLKICPPSKKKKRISLKSIAFHHFLTEILQCTCVLLDSFTSSLIWHIKEMRHGSCYWATWGSLLWRFTSGHSLSWLCLLRLPGLRHTQTEWIHRWYLLVLVTLPPSPFQTTCISETVWSLTLSNNNKSSGNIGQAYNGSQYVLQHIGSSLCFTVTFLSLL